MLQRAIGAITALFYLDFTFIYRYPMRTYGQNCFKEQTRQTYNYKQIQLRTVHTVVEQKYKIRPDR